ncbi:MAG: family 1 encapsulin nanocompartment shell protein [Acidimicrobiales bacterium]|jgi:uncharacterized linocin/CFP29 family protein
MNHLMRDLAPVTEAAWAQIDAEAERSLKHFLAARRLVDFVGPRGYEHSAVDLGRTEQLESTSLGTVQVARRLVVPLLELRAGFSLPRAELAAADRGATDLELSAVIEASRAAALAEDGIIFHGYESGAIAGIGPSSPYDPVGITDDYSAYPEHVAKAVAILRAADVAGPYAVALGSRCFTGVTETTEHGGYPVFEHLRQILGGPVVWAPAVDGAIVLSQRGGDYEMTVGEDYSVGYSALDVDTVELYIEESLAFRINAPEAAVCLTHG